jgi:hypothetical protein
MGRKNRRRLKPGEWGLFAASSAVLLVGLALTAAIWTGLTRLLRHHWPWDRHLERVTATTSQLDVTKVALSVVAGVGAAIALTVTYRRQRDIERARFDERLAAGAAQLGADSAAQRLAGVYTIAALADETVERRQQCIDLLCAYLRLDYDPGGGLLRSVTSEHTWPIGTATGREERTYERLPNDRDVRAAIVDTIRTHLQADGLWIGYDFNFAGAVFDGANFDGVHFTSGTVYFDRARFVGGNVSFDGAQFTGATIYFNHAEFTGATVYFNETRFAIGTTRFSDAHFAKGLVHFDEVIFASGNVNFKRVEFAGAEVTFNKAKYVDGNVYFTGATFTGGTVHFGSTGGPAAPDVSRSVVSFQGTQGVPGVANLGDLQSRVGQVMGPDGQPLTQPELFE